MKGIKFPILFLITLFSSNIFHVLLFLFGMNQQSGMLQQFYIPLSVITYILFIKDYVKGRNRPNNVIAFLIFIVILYCTPSLFVSPIPELYISTLLYFCSICIAATIQGTHIYAYPDNKKKIDIILPYFIIPLSIITGSVSFTAAVAGIRLTNMDSGFDYQLLSYYMAEMFTFSMYYVYFSNAKEHKSFVYFKWVMYVIIPFSIITCITAGGRGGLVYLVAVTILFVYLFLKNGKLTKNIFIGLIIILVGLIYITNHIGITQSNGYLRLTEHFFEDEGRRDLYSKASEIASASFYMGNGLGSVWWTIGYSCHNIFWDWILEIGIFGTLFMICIFYKMFKRLFDRQTIDPFCVFILLVFLRGFILCLFSSYWLNEYHIWIAFGYLFAKKNKRKLTYESLYNI